MQQYSIAYPPKALIVSVGGGEPLESGVIDTWKSMTGVQIRDGNGWPHKYSRAEANTCFLFQGYGQTETILLVCSGAGMAIKPGSMGKPVPGVAVEIIDEKGDCCPAGQEGDIAVLQVDKHSRRSPWLYHGYLSKDGTITLKTRKWLDSTGTILGEWYITGDRAYKDDDGYFWFMGRSDDVINSSGYRIGAVLSVQVALLLWLIPPFRAI